MKLVDFCAQLRQSYRVDERVAAGEDEEKVLDEIRVDLRRALHIDANGNPTE